MDVVEIVKKLIGPIDPVGESGEDARRLSNIDDLTNLVDRLLFEIYEVSKYSNRSETSMKDIGSHAMKFLQNLNDEISEFKLAMDDESQVCLTN